MMSRKDYVALVNALGENYRGQYVGKQAGLEPAQYYESGWLHAVWAVIGVLIRDNPRFNKDVFEAALEYRITTGHLVRVGQKNFDHNPFRCEICMERVGYDTKGKPLNNDIDDTDERR